MKKVLYGILMLALAGACTPEKYDVMEMGMADLNQVDSIKMRMSHFQLLADGKAELEFRPLLQDGTFEVQEDRVDYSKIEFLTVGGEVLPRVYSTDDRNLIGKEIQVYARIKESGILSDTVSFTVMDPTPAESYTEMVVPVVFHLMQANEDITSYGGEIPKERIYQLLDKINHTFSGSASRNAMGVNTKITFRAAEYDPYGSKMNEAGINRIYVDEVVDTEEDKFDSFIVKEKALWDHDKYLNVWLLSERKGEYDFYYDISKTCIPYYVNAGVTDIPQGLALTVLPEGWSAVPHEVGIIYKLQSLFLMVRHFGDDEENELVNCFGSYFGLLPTCGYDEDEVPEDYCTDTHKYYGSDGYNTSLNKTVGSYYFTSENIMDDPTGVHRSVSLQQSQRMRWVLNNCPGRSAWKSDYAFTGK